MAAPDTQLTVAATKTTGVKVIREATNTWDFPYCTRCLWHIHYSKKAQARFQLIFNICLILTLAMYFYSPTLAICIGVAGLFAAFCLRQAVLEQAKSFQNPTCACMDAAVAFLNWDNTCNAFEIVSSQYVLSFMVANMQKLVNISPQARHLLESNGYGQWIGNQQSPRRYRS